MTRRDAIRSAAFTIIPAHLVRGYQANSKLDIGIIGIGGVGAGNARRLAELGENIAAICDVDPVILEDRSKLYPKARRHSDFRRMFDAQKLDGVVVATPDHSHTVISVMAMKRGIHVYCQKPLTRTIREARLMAEVAAKQKVVTQMGTASASSESTRQTMELIRSGTLGEVTEVHCWTNRALWPQGFDRPAGEDPIPATMNWDLWLGPAQARPYKAKWPEGHLVYNIPSRLDPFPEKWWRDAWANVYHPFTWRGWQDFGTGALGDIAPHSLNVVYWGLELGPPSVVEVVETSGMTREMYPTWSVIRYDFPARGVHPPLMLYWYDGGKMPPPEIAGEKAIGGGLVLIGSKGSLPAGRGPFFGNKVEPYPVPKRMDWDYDEVHSDWTNGIKSGKRPSCDFAYAGPFTEAYLLGNIALKVGHRVEWNANSFQVTNCREANQYLSYEYRKGWELPG
jgi:predicted dehydrogenase